VTINCGTDGRLNQPNFEGVYGITANPLRLIYLMGTIWYLSQKCKHNHVQVLEIGSWCGASTLTWGESIEKYFNSNGSITCVDAWVPYIDLGVNPTEDIQMIDNALRKNEVFDVFKHNIQFLTNSIEIKIHKGWSQDILPSLEKETYDLVYIDGDHKYDIVVSDIKNAVPLLRNGGIMCGDDLELQLHECEPSISNINQNVDRLYNEALDTYYHPGVTQAVGEYFGAISSWAGYWAVEKCDNGWKNISLEHMPANIPSHLNPKSLIGLKVVLMEMGLF